MSTPQVYNRLITELRELTLNVVADSLVNVDPNDDGGGTVTVEVDFEKIEALCQLAGFAGGYQGAEEAIEAEGQGVKVKEKS